MPGVRYKQINSLFHNNGEKVGTVPFTDITKSAGSAFSKRSAAVEYER